MYSFKIPSQLDWKRNNEYFDQRGKEEMGLIKNAKENYYEDIINTPS